MTVAANDPTMPGTTVSLRPQFEGANVGPWIGFKHVNYMVEEAILAHFRNQGLDVRSLYADDGLCFEIVDIDTRIIRGLRLEDELAFHINPSDRAPAPELAFDVVIQDESGVGKPIKMAISKVVVLLRRDSRWPAPAGKPALQAVDTIVRSKPQSGFGSTCSALDAHNPGSTDTGQNSFSWKMRIPYFYCHFTERLQMSGYLRVMEEAVDRLLADRGVSIRSILEEHQLIPAVPRSRIIMVGEAYMEEELHTILTIDQIFKDLTFTATMESYVMREGKVVNTAVGAITHGYARLDGRASWTLANLNDRLRTALAGNAQN